MAQEEGECEEEEQDPEQWEDAEEQGSFDVESDDEGLVDYSNTAYIAELQHEEVSAEELIELGVVTSVHEEGKDISDPDTAAMCQNLQYQELCTYYAAQDRAKLGLKGKGYSFPFAD